MNHSSLTAVSSETRQKRCSLFTCLFFVVLQLREDQLEIGSRFPVPSSHYRLESDLWGFFPPQQCERHKSDFLMKSVSVKLFAAPSHVPSSYFAYRRTHTHSHNLPKKVSLSSSSSPAHEFAGFLSTPAKCNPKL